MAMLATAHVMPMPRAIPQAMATADTAATAMALVRQQDTVTAALRLPFGAADSARRTDAVISTLESPQCAAPHGALRPVVRSPAQSSHSHPTTTLLGGVSVAYSVAVVPWEGHIEDRDCSGGRAVVRRPRRSTPHRSIQ